MTEVKPLVICLHLFNDDYTSVLIQKFYLCFWSMYTEFVTLYTPATFVEVLRFTVAALSV